MRLEDPATFKTLRASVQYWSETYADRFAQRSIEIDLDVDESNTDKQMVALGLEGAVRIGQFLLWETGEAELGAIDVPTEKEVLVETREITTLFGLQEGLCAVTSAVLGEETTWPLPLK